MEPRKISFTVDHTHMIAIAVTVLVVASAFSAGGYLYLKGVKAQATADAVHAESVKQVEGLKSEIRTLQDAGDKRVKELEQDKQDLKTSLQAAQRLQQSLSKETGKTETFVPYQPTPREVQDAKDRGDKLPDSPGAKLTADQLVALGKRDITCEQNETALNVCREVSQKQAATIAVQDNDLKTQRRVQHPGFWRSLGRGLKIGAPAAVGGAVVAIILGRKKG